MSFIELARLRERAGRSDGFTVVEVALAVAIFGTTMVLMLGMMTAGLRGVLQSKQRSVATTEANAVLERARDLAFEDVGLVSAASGDPTVATSADAAIVDVGGNLMYAADDPCNAGLTKLEPLVFAKNLTGHPFNPHMSTYQVGDTLITRYVYVTGADTTCPADGTIDVKRVTARVVFERPGVSSAAAANEVVQQTLLTASTPGAPGAPPAAGVPPIGPTPTPCPGCPTPSTTPPPTPTPTPCPGCVPLPPLSGMAHAKGGSAIVNSAIGPGACTETGCSTEEAEIRLVQSRSKSSSLTRHTVGCWGASPRLRAVDETKGPRTREVTADDNPSTGTPSHPTAINETHTESPTAGGRLDDYLAEPSVVTTIACDADAPSYPGQPTTDGATTVTGSGGAITFARPIGSGGYGAVELLKTTGSTAESEVVHSGPPGTRQVDFSTTGGLGDMKVIAIGVPSIGLDATKGVIHVKTHAFTARTATSPGVPTTQPDGDGGGTLTVELFDPNSAIPNTDCVGRLPGDPYCVVVIDPDLPGFTGKTVSISRNMGSDRNQYPFSLDTRVTFERVREKNGEIVPGGRVFEASYAPMIATTRLILRVPGPLHTPLTPSYIPVFDAAVKFDLGQVLARGCFGMVSGVPGCEI